MSIASAIKVSKNTMSSGLQQPPSRIQRNHSIHVAYFPSHQMGGNVDFRDPQRHEHKGLGSKKPRARVFFSDIRSIHITAHNLKLNSNNRSADQLYAPKHTLCFSSLPRRQDSVCGIICRSTCQIYCQSTLMGVQDLSKELRPSTKLTTCLSGFNGSTFGIYASIWLNKASSSSPEIGLLFHRLPSVSLRHLMSQYFNQLHNAFHSNNIRTLFVLDGARNPLKAATNELRKKRVQMPPKS